MCLRKRDRENKGFTLAELLIVVAIIAVLVAIAVPVFGAQLNASKVSVDHANARTAYAIARTAQITGSVEVDGTTYTVAELAVTVPAGASLSAPAGTGYGAVLLSAVPLSAPGPDEIKNNLYFAKDGGVTASTDKAYVLKGHEGTGSEKCTLCDIMPSLGHHGEGGYIRIWFESTADGSVVGHVSLTDASSVAVASYSAGDGGEPDPVSYTVTFDANGGSWSSYETERTQSVVCGDPVESPTDRPTNGWCSFSGWHTDPVVSSPYTFSTPVTGNLTLYAHWAASWGSLDGNDNDG